ncbi:hypothetical protein M406DRAFT_343662 [Cryphonectria parasitica EP155]|uniref:Aminoglycoside phosphotransferase domain-containing protein n=1 Tax=Cryphonectria parasitica (strain ATCC 38755 / EP155) TaxID=660469 RepID=A0A9P4XQR3_CRYP1|nr:uncharacterized protein M406DRAFT_343662 [Cryphonectria parasitica EP155]KAF3760059.1 hypothetical protein M406DRAFT_343662 [Cryphonectria parasitica EP155]
MDISKYAAEAKSYNKLSAFQISRFFERQGPTRADCDRLAAEILSCPVSPTPIQGATSYTVAAADSNQARKIVQFCFKKLAMKHLELAKQSYEDFVPNCKYHSTMLRDVHVYEWDLVPGPAFCLVRHQFLGLNSGMEQYLYQTVEDFARFFASAWNNRPAVEQPLGLLDQYSEILDQVSQGLPEQLQAKLDKVQQRLPLLFRPSYPIALQHDDLLENNIHVNEATGHITGIIDWADAIIAPFDVSLSGLETILGVQTLTSWHFHPNYSSLREYFWETLYRKIGNVSGEDRRSIEVARLFGLFRTYGFEDKAVFYLEASCLI